MTFSELDIELTKTCTPGDIRMHLKKVNLHSDKYPTREHYPFNLDLFNLLSAHKKCHFF